MPALTISDNEVVALPPIPQSIFVSGRLRSGVKCLGISQSSGIQPGSATIQFPFLPYGARPRLKGSKSVLIMSSRP